jgi:hypothetical protein
MKRIIRFLLVSALICTQTGAAREAALLIQNNPEKEHTPESLHGLWILKYPSGEKLRIRSKAITFSSLSPGGRKVAYVANDSLYTANNDGTSTKAVIANKGWWKFGSSFQDANAVHWSTNGMFWIGGYKIYRYIPETGDMTTLPIDLSNIDGATPCVDGLAKGGKEKMYQASRDGLRVFLEASWNAPDIPCRKYDRGGRLRLQWAPDFKSYQVMFQNRWGHGRCMTADGYLFLVCFGFHRNIHVSRQEGRDTTMLYDWCELDPPYEQEGMEARQIASCINNDSLIGSYAHCTDKAPCSSNRVHMYLWNWRTIERLGEFALPGSPSDNALIPTTVWDGPLPQASTSPYIQLNQTSLTFNYDGKTAPQPQTITVTNAGAGNLGAVTATVKPSSISWLSVQQSGSGNSQTVTGTITTANLSQDISEATVTVSGGGASNEATYTVHVYKGSVIAPPGDVSAEAAGDSLLDALITWTDNANNESGFIIERKTAASDWSEAGRTAANASSFTDKNLAIGTEYFYRVAAYATDNDSERKSAYSSEAKVTIAGMSWIRVPYPRDGDQLKSNAPYTIEWTTNRVNQVYIELSRDGGLTWDVITPEGGIVEGGSDWGKYVWTAPSEEISSAIIRVHEYLDETFGMSGEFSISKDAMAMHNIAVRHNFCSYLQLRNKIWIINAPDNKPITAHVLNSSGRIIISRTIAASSSLELLSKDFSKGLYLVKLADINGTLILSKIMPVVR